MSQRNPETEAMGMGLVVIGVGCFLIMFVFYAVICFAALVMTLFMLWAWDKDRTIGSLTITREEARTFLYGGAAGAVILPIFVLFCVGLLKSNFPEAWWSYVFLGGYSFGALGFSGMAYIDAEKKKEQAADLVIVQAPETHITRSLPASDAPPFQYASWDDEAGR